MLKYKQLPEMNTQHTSLTTGQKRKEKTYDWVLSNRGIAVDGHIFLVAWH